jgi:hypothetical protein
MKGGKMRLFIPALLAVVVIAFAQTGYAKEPVEFTAEFFNTIKAGKISEAYDHLFAGSSIPSQKPQSVEVLKRQTATALPLYGAIIGPEKFREEKIGDSIVRLVYILKMERAPTVWEFYFYKPKEQWFLAYVVFNDQFQQLNKIE